MTYGNYMGQNPYMFNQHPSYFASAMQQNYGLPVTQQPQPQQPPQNQQQTITTQPPIMQPQASGKIIPVSNKDEATAAQVDLVYGTPSFFHNKSQNEIYLKQFDVPTGTAIFKTFVEKPIEEVIEAHVDNYDKQLNYISEGVDSLHRLLLQMQKEDVEEEIIEKPKGKKNA